MSSVVFKAQQSWAVCLRKFIPQNLKKIFKGVRIKRDNLLPSFSKRLWSGCGTATLVVKVVYFCGRSSDGTLNHRYWPRGFQTLSYQKIPWIRVP